MKLLLTSSVFVIFITSMVSCMSPKRVVMVWRHILPEVADHETSNSVAVQNKDKIGKKFQQQQLKPVHSDAIIITPIRRIRRDAAQQQQPKPNGVGKTRFFKLCVTVKNGKCIRKKLFGMWNSSRGSPNAKLLTKQT